MGATEPSSDQNILVSPIQLLFSDVWGNNKAMPDFLMENSFSTDELHWSTQPGGCSRMEHFSLHFLLLLT